jgi:GT2 family glycosyltransferase
MVAFMDANAPVGALNCKIRELSGSAFGPGLQWFPSPLTELAKFFLVSRETQGRLPRLFPYHDPETSGFVRKLFGGCLLVRRCVLDQVGAFDERFFMYCEDVDLSRRIDSAGWKLYYLSEAEIFHLGGSASSRVSGRFSVLMMCESLSKLMRKYHGRLGSWGYRIVALVGAQFRLAILLMLRLLMSLGWSGDKVEVASSFGKYVTITRWSLGLSKPAIPTSVASPGRNVSLSLPAEVTAPADRAGHGA